MDTSSVEPVSHKEQNAEPSQSHLHQASLYNASPVTYGPNSKAEVHRHKHYHIQIPEVDVSIAATAKKNNPVDTIIINLAPNVENYHGRNAENTLTRLIKSKKQIKKNVIKIAVVGRAGSGKTELVKRYAHLYEDGQLIAFFSSQSPAVLWDYYRLFAAKILEKKIEDIPTEGGSAYCAFLIIEVNRALKKNPNFLLIFDNVQNRNDIEKYIKFEPDIIGIVLITSQNLFTLDSGSRINLNDGLEVEEAIRLLEDTSGCEIKDFREAKELIFYFNNMPLPIVSVGYVIKNSEELTISNYLEEKRKNFTFLEKKESEAATSFYYRDTQHQVLIETLKIMYNNLYRIRNNESYCDLLFFLGMVFPDEIPRELIRKIMCDETGLVEDILLQYSMLHKRQTNSYFIHRDSQRTIREFFLKKYEVDCQFLFEIFNKIFGRIFEYLFSLFEGMKYDLIKVTIRQLNFLITYYHLVINKKTSEDYFAITYSPVDPRDTSKEFSVDFINFNDQSAKICLTFFNKFAEKLRDCGFWDSYSYLVCSLINYCNKKKCLNDELKLRFHIEDTCFYREMYEEEIAFLENSIILCVENEAHEYKVETLYLLAANFRAVRNFDESYRLIMQAKELYYEKRIENQNLLARLYYNLCAIKMEDSQHKNLDYALIDIKLGIECSRKSKDYSYEIRCILRLAKIYILRECIEDAEKTLKKINISDIFSERTLMIYHGCYAEMEFFKKNYDSAITYAELSIEKALLLGIKKGLYDAKKIIEACSSARKRVLPKLGS